jgi:hypothetical protein
VVIEEKKKKKKRRRRRRSSSGQEKSLVHTYYFSWFDDMVVVKDRGRNCGRRNRGRLLLLLLLLPPLTSNSLTKAINQSIHAMGLILFASFPFLLSFPSFTCSLETRVFAVFFLPLPHTNDYTLSPPPSLAMYRCLHC